MFPFLQPADSNIQCQDFPQGFCSADTILYSCRMLRQSLHVCPVPYPWYLLPLSLPHHRILHMHSTHPVQSSGGQCGNKYIYPLFHAGFHMDLLYLRLPLIHSIHPAYFSGFYYQNDKTQASKTHSWLVRLYCKIQYLQSRRRHH